MFSPLNFHHDFLSVHHRLNDVFNSPFGRDPFFPFLIPQLHLLQRLDSVCEEECQQEPEKTATKAPAATAAASETKESSEQKQAASAANNEMAVEAPTTESPSKPQTAPCTSGQLHPQQPASNTNSSSVVFQPWGLGAGALFSSSRNAVSIPRVDVVENSDHFLVKCDLPGISKEDVKVAINVDGVLSVTAERSEKQEHKDENAKVHRVERSYGKFKRSIQLPDNVDVEAVKATQENGTLQISLPKKPKEEPKLPKQIPVY